MKEITIKNLIENLETNCGVSREELSKVVTWREEHPIGEELEHLVPKPKVFYRGTALRVAMYSILANQHLILTGSKGAGKNTLIDTLAYLFHRPLYQFPFNADIDVSMIVGNDTLSIDENGHQIISFRKHQLVQAMESGAWFVGDEINMTRSDVLSVLHMVTDHRNVLDYPSLGKVTSNPGFKFIGTMNYGYMGTKELNEAFGDRFAIVQVDTCRDNIFTEMLKDRYDISDKAAKEFFKLYTDLEQKATRSEISSKAVSIRGILSAIELHKAGLDLDTALEVNVINKTFDETERKEIKDVISTYFAYDIFDKGGK